MECTQRLECTQDLYDAHTERTCPEQIGFLGICGTKYPVVKGPNKIGRDPQTCNIVLNLNSISRQHAVINILNSREFMLMDLGSANKTKLENNTLQAYIPNPLKNGDMVQFGDIFGVFRLLEEDDELPMTQAIDIPETPAPSRHITKFNKAPITLIPESPDVSDKEDSFITLSKERKCHDTQAKNENQKLSNSQFIKPFGKTLSIHPVSSPKTDSKQNSRRSSSISFVSNPNTSLNESLAPTISVNSSDIHEMDTQPPDPIINESNDSIYTADTQVPEERGPSPAIHSLDTQIPVTTSNQLPQVRKIHNQHDMQFDLCAANKENDISIYNAETQPFPFNESIEIKKADVKDKKLPASPRNKTKLVSDEDVLFDENDGDPFDDDFNSQTLLPPVLPFVEEKTLDTKGSHSNLKGLMQSKLFLKRNNVIQSELSTDCEDDLALPVNQNIIQNTISKPVERTTRIKSDSSTDCEDFHMMPTQKIDELPVKESNKYQVKMNSSVNPSKRVIRIDSDSSTDCEDMIPTQKIDENKADKDDDLTDCEDDLIVTEQNKSIKPKNDDMVKFEDMDTQILQPIPNDDDFHNMSTQVIEKDTMSSPGIVDINDIPTQILGEVIENDLSFEKPLKVVDSPFKIPLQTSIKTRSKDISKLTPNNKTNEKNTLFEDTNKYYVSTQDVFDDLCSQREGSPEILPAKGNLTYKSHTTDEVVPCSVEDYKVGDRFANIEKDLSPKYVADKSSSSDGDDRTKKYVNNLSSQQVRDIIGVDGSVKKLKRMPSDGSDVDKTPKKIRPIKFTDFDLPNSQEIKTSVSVTNRPPVSVTSSDSETENNSEDQYTPILHRKKKPLSVTKIDLTKKFEVEKLPERVITRVRKPTAKVADNKEAVKNILKPKFLTEQEDQIDKDIIIENITRLKNKDKCKVDPKKNDKVIEKKTSRNTQKKSEKKTEAKEKIKVKIERPKNKDSKKNEPSRKSHEDNKKKSIEVTQDPTVDTGHISRNTRSRKRGSDKKLESPEIYDPKPSESRMNRSNKDQKKIEERLSPEIEVRRSKRQQTKEKKESSKKEQPKSILKNSIHEHSTVYNMSSSSTETVGLKRSAMDDSGVPSPKRTRSVASNNTSNVSLRATPARLTTHHVLFTAFPCEEVKQKLEKLGAVIVTDVTACTIVLTMQIKRTFKLLCAVGLGRPIVGPNWVQACVDTHMIVDPWLYLMRDDAAEERFHFSLQKSLSGRRNYLKGYNISSTPSVQPNATEMKLIVECSGGSWKEEGPNWVCVSSSADKALWPSLRKRGATVVSTEFILGGVLRQKLDIAANKFI